MTAAETGLVGGMRHRTALVSVLGPGAAFLAMLDTTVVNLAIPDLRGAFTHASVPDLTWIITLYAVVFAALLASAGRMADVMGRRALFRTGVGVFTVMSAVCAVAPNLSTLLVARALQGVGAAAMIPASLALLLHDTEPERRAGAIGRWSAAGALAAAVGPSLGGILVDALGWRSLFYINVPIGLALFSFARRVSPAQNTHRRLPDVLGSALLGCGLGGLTLGITQGSSWQWVSVPTIGVLAGGAAALALALWRATRHPVPAVEVSLWRNRGYAVVNVVTLLYGAALYPWLLAGVLFLTEIWHYTELEAGLAVSPGALTAALASMVLGRLSHVIGPRTAIIGGACILAAVALWFVFALPVQPRFLGYWLPLGLVVGTGIGAPWGRRARRPWRPARSASPVRPG